MLKIGVIGYGYWGPNLVRNFSETDGCQVSYVSDLSLKRLDAAKKRYPSITAIQSASELINNPQVDAVAISTPVSTHFDLAMLALKAGKHVLVEKPITATSEQALRLIEAAEKRGLTLMVDHTFIYTGAVRKMRDLVESGDLGDIYYYDSARVNLGLFQHDVNVVWDLAVHDLAIMNYVIPARPVAVSATGYAHIPGEPENIAYMTVYFDEPVMAHISVNWLAPVKVRRTLLGGSKRMIVYDDLEPSEKIKVYDKGVVIKDDPQAVYKTLVSYRTGDMVAPQLDTTEALALEAKAFLKCVMTGEKPFNDGRAGLEVVRILEAASKSMRLMGQMVKLDEKGLD